MPGNDDDQPIRHQDDTDTVRTETNTVPFASRVTR